jgi:hypothetical protein
MEVVPSPKALNAYDVYQIFDLWFEGTMPDAICDLFELSPETLFRVLGWTPADLPNDLAALQAELRQFRDPVTDRLLSRPGLASEGAVITPSLREKYQALQRGLDLNVADAASTAQRACVAGLVTLDRCLTYEVAVDEALECTAECLSVLDPAESFPAFSRILNSLKQRPNQLQPLVKFLSRYLSEPSFLTLYKKTKHIRAYLDAFHRWFDESIIRDVVQRVDPSRTEQLSTNEAVLTYFLYLTAEEVELLAVYADISNCQGPDLVTLGVLQLKLCESISLHKDKSEAAPLLSHLKDCITATYSKLTAALDYSSEFAPSYVLVSTSITEFCETNTAAVNPVHCSLHRPPCTLSIIQQTFNPVAKETRDSPSRLVRLSGFDSRTSEVRFVAEFAHELYFLNSYSTFDFVRVDKLRDFAVCSLSVPLLKTSDYYQLEGLRGADYVYLYRSRYSFAYFMRLNTKTQVYEELPMAGWDGGVVAAVEMKITGCLYFVIGEQVFEFDQWAVVWRVLLVHVPVSRDCLAYKSRDYSTSFFLVNADKSKVFTIDVVLDRCDEWDRSRVRDK